MAAVHEATIGAHVINDHCESHFGGWDYLGRIFRPKHPFTAKAPLLLLVLCTVSV